jgi:hypothetical protein
MDALEGASWRAVAGGLLAALLVAACAGRTKQPEPLPPQAVTQQRPETPPPPAPAPRPPAAPTLIVIDAADPEAGTAESLGAAARRERSRRQAVEKPIAVINNQNLAEFAKGQKLTTASAGAEEDATEAGAAEEEAARDEAYWRERGLEIRRRWRSALEDVDRLEGESAELRRRFYAADDPYVRDNQIKPEWDRLLAGLDQARRTLEGAPRELDAYLDEGRRAGALPGWLREGIELEPEAKPPVPDSAEPGEPVVVDQEPGNP